MEKKPSDSRERILQAAERLFAEKGFDGARVDEIARNAGVNKALIYYYFSGKDAILEVLFDDFIRESAGFFLEMAQGEYELHSPETAEVMERYRKYLVRRKDLLKVMMIESMKSGTESPPVFSLVDFPGPEGLDENAVIGELRKRGFKLDEDRNQRMVTEFFTGVLPDVCYIIFKDSWMRHFRISEEDLDGMYRKAIEMTHAAHYDRK